MCALFLIMLAASCLITIKTYYIDSVSYLIFIHSAFHWCVKTKYSITLTTKSGLPQDVWQRRWSHWQCSDGSCIISDVCRLVWQKMFKFWLCCLVVFSVILGLVSVAVIWTVLIYNGDSNICWSCKGCLELLVWGRINCEPLKGSFCCARDFPFWISCVTRWLLIDPVRMQTTKIFWRCSMFYGHGHLLLKICTWIF